MGVILHDHPEKLVMRSLSTLSLPRTPPDLMSTSTLTPPHHAMAAVPFGWEESPGKPKPCSTASPVPVPDDDKSLELPPRLLLLDHQAPIHRSGSAAPVVSFNVGSRSSSRKLMSSSFRESSGETAAFLGRRAVDHQRRKKRGVWWWKLGAMKGENEVGGSSYVFPSYGYGDQQFNNITSSRRVDSHRFRVVSHSQPSSRSHFWESIAEGLKQVVPWRNTRTN